MRLIRQTLDVVFGGHVHREAWIGRKGGDFDAIGFARCERRFHRKLTGGDRIAAERHDLDRLHRGAFKQIGIGQVAGHLICRHSASTGHVRIGRERQAFRCRRYRRFQHRTRQNSAGVRRIDKTVFIAIGYPHRIVKGCAFHDPPDQHTRIGRRNAAVTGDVPDRRHLDGRRTCKAGKQQQDRRQAQKQTERSANSAVHHKTSFLKRACNVVKGVFLPLFHPYNIADRPA